MSVTQQVERLPTLLQELDIQIEDDEHPDVLLIPRSSIALRADQKRSGVSAMENGSKPDDCEPKNVEGLKQRPTPIEVARVD